MSKFLEEAAQYSKECGLNIFRIAEVKDNGPAEDITIVDCPACHDCYSVAKAFVVAGIGMLVDRGIMKTSDTVAEIFPDEVSAVEDIEIQKHWKNTTVHHVLKHQAGFPGGHLDIDAQDMYTYGDRDFLRYCLNTKPAYVSGEDRRYSDAAYYLLSRIFSKVSGELLDDFLWRELFYDLGFREMAWSKCPHGYPMGATGLYVRAIDVAKFGAIFLNNGVYNGKRYLSEEWVKTTIDDPGYELTRNDDGSSFSKGGMFGQNLLVLPHQNRVVAWHGFSRGGDGGAFHRWVVEYKD